MTMAKRPNFFSAWLSHMPFLRSYKDLADVWVGERARASCKTIHGTDEDQELRVCFRNLSDEPLILCWVDHRGKPHHFYELEPCDTEGNVCEDDHVEHTHPGHAFILARSDDIEGVQRRKSLKKATIVGGYRGKKDGLHLVEIRPGREAVACCGAPSRLRGKKGKAKRGDDNDNDDSGVFHLVVRPGVLDPTPLDTTTKQYISTTLGGWPVRLDADLDPNDERLRPLAQDLEVLCKCLPRHASKFLQRSTPLWINDTFQYGPAACPIEAKTCCFHPDVEWLKEMGCHEEKKECVELYDLDDYNDSRDCWKTGGVMLHEYAHAYHYKFLKKGYENKEIRDCYKAAMKQKLYECVGVHGPQGPTAKAYACENQMEYFAELSAAFLGGLDDEEFNKWYPFNRKQIAEHDPKAYEMLKRVWQVQDGK